jgi:hypothetical protein
LGLFVVKALHPVLIIGCRDTRLELGEPKTVAIVVNLLLRRTPDGEPAALSQA